MGCPEDLQGMQNAGPLLLPGNFGKHVSCSLLLKNFVATKLRKWMASQGWIQVGSWVRAGSRLPGRKEGKAFLSGGCVNAIGNELKGGKQRPLLQAQESPELTAPSVKSE